ncbi:MAG: mercuric reductase [Candidatus Binatia bacterium]|nr:MAG: mercuric reductase [Candidatus Binatia bacterium]
MAAVEKCDLLIVGSGSTAFAAALRARELGKSAMMIEERTVGGTCANRGCLPSKNLIEAARIIHECSHPRYPGLRGTALEFDFEELVAQKDALVASYRDKKYESLVGDGIRVERGHAEFVDARTVAIDGKRVTAAAILIATGSRPAIPAVPGLSEVPYLTSDLLSTEDALELKELPKSMLIVGGGYIALELGQMFRRFGTAVTIVECCSELLEMGYEPEVGPALRQMFEAEGIEVLTGATVEEVKAEGDGVTARVAVNGTILQRHVERLLVATGRRPNTDRLRLEAAGVAAGEHGQVLVDEYLRTSVSHIFAAGDVIGSEQHSQMATPVGAQDGAIAAHNALGMKPPRKVDHRVIPRAVFTDPPVATVGMTERQAVAAGHRCWCRALPLSLVPRAGAVHDTRGFIKMVADRDTGEVLGVTMVGRDAPEVIHEAAMALRFRATLQDFVDMIHVYPTMAEALKIAAIARFKDPARLSCCAA